MSKRHNIFNFSLLSFFLLSFIKDILQGSLQSKIKGAKAAMTVLLTGFPYKVFRSVYYFFLFWYENLLIIEC